MVAWNPHLLPRVERAQKQENFITQLILVFLSSFWERHQVPTVSEVQ